MLKQVPNQPVQFRVDLPHPANMYPGEERTEDGIIAYTWHHVAALDPTRPEWALRLPMTKSASKVRQFRHHFGPSLMDVWAFYHPTHAVCCALLSNLVAMLIGC